MTFDKWRIIMNVPMRSLNVRKGNTRGLLKLNMTAELRKHDIKTLISLVTLEIDRLGEEKEKCGCHDPCYFYHLIDMRNKLMAMPLDGEPPPHPGDEELEKLFGGKRVV